MLLSPNVSECCRTRADFSLGPKTTAPKVTAAFFPTSAVGSMEAKVVSLDRLRLPA
jgi:hypothetical protein